MKLWPVWFQFPPPQIYSIDLSKDFLKAVACDFIWKYMDSSLNWFMSGDLPTVSSNSAAATKIFAKAVLLKTILSERWCTYSANRARAKTFGRIMLSVHRSWIRSHLISSLPLKSIHHFGESCCTQEHDISNWQPLRFLRSKGFTSIPKETCTQSQSTLNNNKSVPHNHYVTAVLL